MSRRACVILAAGQGTRMKSPLPKVLHPVGGRAMLDRAIDTAEALGCETIVVVVGAHSPEVGAHVEKRLGAGSTAVQDPPLGTGHAVLAAKDALAVFDGDVLITYADVPLLDARAIEPLFELRGEDADLGVLGFEAKEPGAYGRLMLNAGRDLLAIVEAKEASAAELQVRPSNTGVMVAPRALLFDLLGKVGNQNAKGEYYLTDVVALARADRRTTRAAFASEEDVMGVNSQAELAEAEAIFQRRTRARLMADGVSMTAPDTVYFSADTEIEGGVPH